MKRLSTILGIVAASVLFVSVPLLSADSTTIGGESKNECLLLSKNCADSVDSIQQRIDRLNTEISKGTGVYTKDELRMLNNKLDEAVKTLEYLEKGEYGRDV